MSQIFKTKELAEAFNEILNTFTGADGGVKFLLFRVFLENLEEQSLNGDNNASRILDMVKGFNKLIQIANEQHLA